MKTSTTINGIHVEYRLTVQEEDIPVRGNALASGDDTEDRKAEDEIIARLDAGDVWAWASVLVTAELTLDGETYQGHDALGGCSYADEEDFKKGGYYEDMLAAALDDLKTELSTCVRHGRIATAALELLS